MAELPESLRHALAAQLAGTPAEALRASVARLIEAYRSGTPPRTPILTGPADVAAYAAYRMPATYAAVRSALAAGAPIEAETLLDLGGGTGAAAWAAADAVPGLARITVVDGSRDALALGARLAAQSPSPALRGAQWHADALAAAPADLLTISYVLGELPPADAAALVASAAAAGPW